MAKLIWDEIGKRFYETGVRQGVLYLPDVNENYSFGVAWNGLVSVTESPSGAEPNPIYADDIKYLNIMSAEEFGASIESYTYPDEFGVCDGSVELTAGVLVGQQKRKIFGLSYRTILGNDVADGDYGYKIHLVYGAIAAPSEKAYSSVNDSPEAITFSWDLTTTPVKVTGHRPTSSLVIDSTKIHPTRLSRLEQILYGSDNVEPRMPFPDEVIDIIRFSATYSITDLISGISSELRVKPLDLSLAMSRYALMLDDAVFEDILPVDEPFITVPIAFESDRVNVAFYDNQSDEPTSVTTLEEIETLDTGSTGVLKIEEEA